MGAQESTLAFRKQIYSLSEPQVRAIKLYLSVIISMMGDFYQSSLTPSSCSTSLSTTILTSLSTKILTFYIFLGS